LIENDGTVLWKKYILSFCLIQKNVKRYII
jgi:hypothetical protein